MLAGGTRRDPDNGGGAQQDGGDAGAQSQQPAGVWLTSIFSDAGPALASTRTASAPSGSGGLASCVFGDGEDALSIAGETSDARGRIGAGGGVFGGLAMIGSPWGISGFSETTLAPAGRG